jgi:hypothetical protein
MDTAASKTKIRIDTFFMIRDKITSNYGAKVCFNRSLTSRYKSTGK